MTDDTTTRRDARPETFRAELAGAWRSALGLDVIEDGTHFFHEGGDSVLAVEVALLLRELTGTELDLDILYEYPEFGSLVAALTGPGAGEARQEGRELTGPEERLWAVEQLHPGTAVHHICVAYRFPHRLDVDRVRSALNALAGRHDALRRGFVRPGRTVTAPEPTVPCRWVDARGVAEASVRELVDTEARAPFDLARPPLLRALVVDEGEAGSRLVLTVHHLVCDGVSLTLLEEDVQRLYAGEPDPGPDGGRVAPARVRTVAPDAAPGAALEEWRAALADRREGLRLPHDLPRPARPGTRGAAHRVTPAPERLEPFLRAAREERLSGFMAWTAAYVAALVSVTGDRDLVVCVPVSAREPERAAEIGMFVDLVPLRFRVPPGTTARELLRHTRRVITRALARPVPFQAIVEALGTGAGGRAPLAQTALTYLDTAGCGLRLDGYAAEREQVPTGTAKFELLWAVTRASAGTVCELEWSADLFTAERGADLHRRVLRAVEDAFAEPDAPLAAAETAPASVPAPAGGGTFVAVHERVRQRAAERPEAVAVRHGGRELSYGELDRRASAVAAGLRAAGYGRGTVVAVPAERGLPSVVACLGVLYAGCAYLPLDAGQPGERTRETVRAAAGAALVTDGASADLLSGLVPVHRLDELTARGGGPFAPTPVTGADVAYVMCTSGSTGRPKAVVVPHRAVSRLVPDADFVTFTERDRVAHVSNPAFDAATFELWGALAGGGTLVVADRDVLLSPDRMRAFLAEERITVMFLTVTLLNQLVDFAPDAFRDLRVLVFGGEKQDDRRLEKLFAAGPPARVVNGYGPTENTTFSTTHDVTPRDLADGVVPLGGPLPGSTAYVLDADGAPVPPGGTGELYVGGEGLAHGYLDAPELTATAFVPDPFSTEGGRLYRTGDQVRVLPDGGIAYVGRLDDQVKVRGHRVEPAETVRALRDRDGVADAVVLPRRTPEGTELVAFAVPVTGPHGTPVALDGQALRERLAETLPPYLLPAALRVVDRIPATPNGKADRQALLAALDTAGPQPVAGPADAPDPLAEAVATLWCEVLGTERAAPGDDFHRLGGHSLKALRLLARLDEELAAEVELVDFFAEPTLAALTRLARTAHAQEENR
ncbi:non-ribosomal peptide synthetase [Streptomyces sp. WMMC897]|uniref:non-ribosomal peptide synthetase n=1 Tax=Streptomyces sp. WMMC897 TaxID=3014782 RepID=UPI0022B7024C|nr:amino acid adenylation domain-containing protein [Streptomyces sp. WMMC897]MCZ7413617.1 amino acid adenylation domain-containing protein [Streptomyces sp. WMMC897]